MSSPITNDHVKKIAKLARLKLSSAEVKEAAHYLGEIVEYVDRLDAVPTDGVKVYAPEAVGIAHLRQDASEESPARDDLISGDRFTSDDLLETKAIVTRKK